MPTPPGHLLPCRYWENSILFDMGNFQYNDKYARLALGGAAPPKEFTFIYFVGYGCLPPDHVARQLRQMNESGDAVVLNLGPHCLAQLSFPEWRRSMDEVAGQLASMRSRVVWRTSFPMREDALRTPLPDASSYTPHLLFPVSRSCRHERRACSPAGGACWPAPLPQLSVAPCASWQLGRAQPLPAVRCMLAYSWALVVRLFPALLHVPHTSPCRRRRGASCLTATPSMQCARRGCLYGT